MPDCRVSDGHGGALVIHFAEHADNSNTPITIGRFGRANLSDARASIKRLVPDQALPLEGK